MGADSRPWTGFDSFGHIAVAAVLVTAFVTGGSATDRGAGDLPAQLLAVPLFAWAMVALHVSPGTRWRRLAVAVSLSILAILAVQQLPVGEGLWRSVAVRDALAGDLANAGVVAPRYAWSLSPVASERGLWSVMPALAVFLAALVMPMRHHRWMLLVVVALGAASMLLGFLQLGAAQDSVLNPFPELAPMFGGLFAHFNHQATMLGVCTVVIAALLVHDAGPDIASPMPRAMRFGLVALAVFMLASLPLTTSRAIFPLTVFGLVAVPLMLGRGHWGASRGRVGAMVVLGLLGLGAVVVAVAWLRFDIAEEVRWSAASATASLGRSFAPVGAGLGSFVAWFDQAAPAVLTQQPYYQNHAHNEYAQWWFESGVPGAIVAGGAIALLLACYPGRPAALRDQGVAVAAWLGCLLILLHSWVDYPLRTPALMTTAGLLAGIVVAQRSARGRRRRSSARTLSSIERRQASAP